MAKPSFTILHDGVLIEKPTFTDLLALTTEMKPEGYALLQKMFEKSVASLEQLTEEEREAKKKALLAEAEELKKKRLLAEAEELKKKKAIKKEMTDYISKRFSWLMKRGVECYNEGNMSHEITIAFLRKEEWDAEAFDKALNELAGDAEGYLNEAKTSLDFTINVHANDKFHKDGLSTKWLCELSWDDGRYNPFDEVYARGDEVCDDTDSDDDDE
jgi:hypothetical protein